MRLPTETEIRARAEELSLLEPGADLDTKTRRAVAKALLEERKAPPKPAAPPPLLLSRTTHPAAGGLLQIDVVFISTTPTPQEGPSK